MKSVALFLVVLVLMLSGTPCTAVTIDGQHQTEQCDDNDGNCKCCCSPFFCCGTCAGFAIDVMATAYSTGVIVTEPILENASVCDDQIHSSFFCNIWQPPQLA